MATQTAELVRSAGEVASRRVALDITLFTDPACPFAFSAEPIRQRCAGTTATSCAGGCT